MVVVVALAAAVFLWHGFEGVRTRLAIQRHLLTRRPGHDWPMVGGNPQFTRATDEVIRPPLRVVWTTTPDVSRFGGIAPDSKRPVAGHPVPGNIGDPIVYRGIVYCTAATRLMALDGWSGRILWIVPTDETEPTTRRTPPCAARGVVCCAVGKVVYAFDARTGKRLWKRPLPIREDVAGYVAAPVLMDGGLVAVGFDDDGSGRGLVVSALDLKDGREVWRMPPRDAVRGDSGWRRATENGQEVWYLPPDGKLDGYGPSAGGVLYANSSEVAFPKAGSEVTDVDPATGKRVPVSPETALRGHGIIAIDGRSGRILWERPFQAKGRLVGDGSLSLMDVRRNRLYGHAIVHATAWVVAFGIGERNVVWREPSIGRQRLWPKPGPRVLDILYDTSVIDMVLTEDTVGVVTNVRPDYRHGLVDFTCVSGIDAASGRLLWRLVGDGGAGQSAVAATPVREGSIVACGHLLYGFAVGKALAFETRTGNVLWDSIRGPAPLRSGAFTGVNRAAVSRGRIFLSNGSDIVALDGSR
ncbi:MAG: PQQ-binding-like beta-propeller repeat protein [Armatimonadetes bacterium]|nr:PQQ-binding-like beta-propeller repeat protein [Armatimonadota bacterium]